MQIVENSFMFCLYILELVQNTVWSVIEVFSMNALYPLSFSPTQSPHSILDRGNWWSSVMTGEEGERTGTRSGGRGQDTDCQSLLAASRHQSQYIQGTGSSPGSIHLH